MTHILIPPKQGKEKFIKEYGVLLKSFDELLPYYRAKQALKSYCEKHNTGEQPNCPGCIFSGDCLRIRHDISEDFINRHKEKIEKEMKNINK